MSPARKRVRSLVRALRREQQERAHLVRALAQEAMEAKRWKLLARKLMRQQGKEMAA